MSKTSGKSAGAKIFTFIVVLLILAALAVVIYWLVLTNGGASSVVVRYNGRIMRSVTENVRLENGVLSEFEIENLSTSQENITYDIKVLPNKENNFHFAAGDNQMSFGNVGELTGYFDVKKTEGGFTMFVPENFSMEGCLQTLYSEPVTVETSLENVDYFILVITFSNKELYNIYFSPSKGLVDVSGITIDPPYIIFGGNGAIVDDDPDGGGELPDNPDGERYVIGWDTLSLGANCLVSVDIPSDAAAGEMVAVTIVADDSVGEVTRVVLCDEGGEDIEDLEQSNGVYTFVMPAHEVNIMIYCVENGY